MNIYYDQIMEIKGAEELHSLVKRWDILSDNISNRHFDAPIILPDLFVYTNPGCGNTKIVSLLAEYLDSKRNLMGFYGDVKFFEFKLDYCKPDNRFTELFRLIDTIDSAAGFRNQYKGIIRINVDEWIEHHKEKHFLDFLQFLQANTAYWFIILTISDTEENEKTQEMEGIVSMYLRIEKITLNRPSDDDFVEFADKYLSKYGLSLDDGAKELLTNSIAVLKNNKYFYGLHTIRDLCNDIVYTLYSESTSVNNIITADMLNNFSPDSEYIKRTVLKIKKTATIGF